MSKYSGPFPAAVAAAGFAVSTTAQAESAVHEQAQTTHYETVLDCKLCGSSRKEIRTSKK